MDRLSFLLTVEWRQEMERGLGFGFKRIVVDVNVWLLEWVRSRFYVY